ncbi:glycosyltransferase family 4 protein [Microbulbifer sp. THAF38]|uniref:MraY family glycosyltransferase n=1 Tax=Microbulbifer sp. THAF38 TaxID=2587856 RepID=UPI0012697872|nr:glycosyltransferase family 4 protein [Microbulbifer sp. THAF38]QFT54346.1 putative undecaprenyl-phosphate N-acetylglucosaminyl 1-phosphate transferase [Microbulbifer sp. THAF38]
MTGSFLAWLLPLLVGGALSYGMTSVLLSRMQNLALDVPNHRSMHSDPVPRTGGWALLAGCGLGLAVGPASFPLPVYISFFLLLAVSAIDDVRHVAARVRFATQLIAAILIVLSLPRGVDWWWLPFLVLAGSWMINLYNFMDGMDGFAGSMTVIGFLSLGLACFFAGDLELAGVCALFVVCTVIFLRFNWPPARIFMGDAGSTGIGLAVFAVSVFGWQREAFQLWFPIIVFSPFWVDASFTLLRRVATGQRWWEAHREHLYQRLALRIGVRKTLHLQLALMVAASSVAFAFVALTAA